MVFFLTRVLFLVGAIQVSEKASVTLDLSFCHIYIHESQGAKTPHLWQCLSRDPSRGINAEASADLQLEGLTVRILA